MARSSPVLVLAVLPLAACQTTLNFSSSVYRVKASGSAMFHKDDFFKLDGIIDSTHKTVTATSVQGTSPDHEITFGTVKTSGMTTLWQLWINSKGTNFTGQCLWTHLSTQLVQFTYFLNDGQVMVTNDEACTPFQQDTCDKFQGCSWCVSKDNIHQLCFEANALPDPAGWDCGGSSKSIVGCDTRKHQDDCDYYQGCSWCVSKDKLHESCFAKSTLPDPAGWDCDGSGKTIV